MESTALLRRRLASRSATGAGLGLLGPVDEPAYGCVVMVQEVRDGGHNSQPDRLAQDFRWGGDEFALLMPDSDHDAAEQAVARLRRAICDTCLGPTGEPVATGWGIAQVTQEVSAREAMARADGLLIAAKQRGRETPGGVLHSS